MLPWFIITMRSQLNLEGMLSYDILITHEARISSLFTDRISQAMNMEGIPMK